MKTVRWGLLSTANINRRLIPAIRASSRGKLAAVASRERAKGEAYAAKWEIPQVFGTYQEMLDSGQVDAVYISLPNHLHAEWSIRALQAGIHVLCEKPFAITLEQVDQMISASQQSECVLAEAFMYRHHPQIKIAGEWVKNGRLGKIRHVHGAFSYVLEDMNNVRMTPEYGGGSLWDVGIYPLSLAQYIYGGPPETVLGMQQLASNSVEVTFAGQMFYPGGGTAQIFSSFTTGFHTYMEIIGTSGRLFITRPFIAPDQERRMTFYPNDGQPEDISFPEEDQYLGEIEDMHAAILDGAPNYVTLQETRDHVRTALALYESANSGKVTHLK